jgi:hypothetical protein
LTKTLSAVRRNHDEYAIVLREQAAKELRQAVTTRHPPIDAWR